jgi:hypothetical protein
MAIFNVLVRPIENELVLFKTSDVIVMVSNNNIKISQIEYNTDQL